MSDYAYVSIIRVESDVIIAVPCCHRELLNQYSYEPFKTILKHGVFKTRLADILTDGMRSLMLEAKGYEVSVVEYISPLETELIKTRFELLYPFQWFFDMGERLFHHDSRPESSSKTKGSSG